MNTQPETKTPEGSFEIYNAAYIVAELKGKDEDECHRLASEAVAQAAIAASGRDKLVEALKYLIPLARRYIDDAKRESTYGIYNVEKEVNKIAALAEAEPKKEKCPQPNCEDGKVLVMTPFVAKVVDCPICKKKHEHS
jgi:hypothetical protein